MFRTFRNFRIYVRRFGRNTYKYVLQGSGGHGIVGAFPSTEDKRQ